MAIPRLDLDKFKKQSLTTKSQYDPAKQVEGYKKRLSLSGLDPEKETDSRNFIEKALNLTPDQNVLFDIFEVLERPQQALFGAWKAKQEGKDVNEAIKAGISGNDVTRFKEILHNYGMADSAEKFGVDDVAGFLGDVFVDPIDIPFMPVKAGAKTAVKAKKALDTALDAKKALGATADASKILKAGKEVRKAQRAFDKASKLRFIAPIEGVFTLAGKGIKGGIKLTDSAVTGILKKADALGADGVVKVADKLGTYQGIKKQLQQTFNMAKEVPANIMTNFRKNMGKSAWNKQELGIIYRHWYKNDFLPTAKALGMNEKVYDETLQGFIEWKKYRPKMTMNDLFVKGHIASTPLDEDTYKLTKEFIDTYLPDSYKVDDFFEKGTTVNGSVMYTIKEDNVKTFQDAVKKVNGEFTPKAEGTLKLREVSAEEFQAKFSLAKDKTPRPEYVDVLDLEEYKNGKAFLSESGEQGIFVSTDGDIKSVFNASDEIKGASEELLLKAIENGGRKLDNFNGFLTKNYEKYGFTPVARMKFDPKYAPKGWKYNKYGKPDVVFMVHNGDPIETILAKKGTYANANISKVKKVNSWDEAVELQQKALGDIEPIRPKSFGGKFDDTLSKEFDAPRFYTPEQIAKYEELAQNKMFTEAADRVDNLQKTMLTKIDETFNTAMAKGTPEGYLKHAITDERKKLQPKNRLEFDDVEKSQLKGNVNEFTGRKYRMSAEEANDIYQTKIKNVLDKGHLSGAKKEFWESKQGMKLFETSINSSLADFIDTAPGFAKDIKQLDDVLIASTFADPDIIRKPIINDAGKAKAEAGYQLISKSDISKKLNKFKNYVPEDVAKRFEDFVKGLPATDKVAMDASVFEMIGRLGDTKEIGALTKLLDFMNNTFKKFKLLSPGFQMRNFIGNSSNMYLMGMNPNDIAKYYKKANNVFKKADDIVERVTINGIGVLSDADKQIYRAYKDFVEGGFHDISREVWDVESIIAKEGLEGKRNVIQKVTDWNFAANQKADERFRMATQMWAKENPNSYMKLGLDSPDALVRHALFDPKDLSRVEKDKLKRLIPFYTFTKKNLAFQMKNIFDNPRRYNHLRKTVRSTWSAFKDIDMDDIEGYKKENFWIPVPGLGEKGKYQALKVNLPMGDLAEFIEAPTKKVLASLTPAIRAPFEMMTNKQIYTDMPISEFKGQKGHIMPNLGRKAEYGLSQFGLDVPGGLIGDIRTTGKEALTGELKGKSAFDIANQTFGRSMTSGGSVEQAQRSKAYQELNQIKELLQYYKQEEIEILTLAQAENKNTTISSLTAKLKSLIN